MNDLLIADLMYKGVIKSGRVADAMGKVNRAHYVPVVHKSKAYDDEPQSLGYGTTISAPHMHAFAIENLLPFLQPGAKVLDLGSSSGYLCAVFYHLIEGNGGYVVGLEHIPEILEWSKENIFNGGLNRALETGDIEMLLGDVALAKGPYDAIHVRTVCQILPSILLEQLACPGRMSVIIGLDNPKMIQVDKDQDGNATETLVMDLMYAPSPRR